MELSKLSMAELRDLLANAQKEEKKRAKSELEAACNEIYAIAHRLNMPLAKLMASGKEKPVRNGAPIQKAAVKYRNPANPEQEWAGRGRLPNWLKEVLATGVDMQTMKVDA